MMRKSGFSKSAQVIDRGDNPIPAIDERNVDGSVGERRRQVDTADASEKTVTGMYQDFDAIFCTEQLETGLRGLVAVIAD